jgi:LacI family transcriptional regulator
MPAKAPQFHKVFVQGAMQSAHARRILEGVATYGHGRTPAWKIRWGNTVPPAAKLIEDGMTGVVLFYPRPEETRLLEQRGLPVVQVSSQKKFEGMANVLPDNRAIGRMAAEHLLERQYQHFAFVGYEGHLYSVDRLQGFREGIGDRPLTCYHFSRESTMDGVKTEGLKSVFSALPARTAVFVANDYFALRVVESIVEMGLRVPQDLAVLGVDNDPLEVLASPVAFSSVDPDSKGIGRMAAMRLERMMMGEADDGQTLAVPPKGVILRESTDHWADADEMVGEALRILRQEACAGLTVDALCARLGVGRRMFERRFGKVLGKTPEAEMRRVRMAQAVEHLANTAWPVEEVAYKVGFKDPLYFSAAFRKAFGVSPRKWRNMPPEKRPRLENA